jgi:hypothetical protein
LLPTDFRSFGSFFSLPLVLPEKKQKPEESQYEHYNERSKRQNQQKITISRRFRELFFQGGCAGGTV